MQLILLWTALLLLIDLPGIVNQGLLTNHELSHGTKKEQTGKTLLTIQKMLLENK